MKKTAIFAILTATAVFAPPAFAGEDGDSKSGFYLTAGTGRINLPNYCRKLEQRGDVDSCTDKEIAYELSGGYQFNRYAGAEWGALAGTGFNASGEIDSAAYDTDGVYTTYALGLRGLVMPAKPKIFGITARAGIHFWEFNSDLEKMDGIDPYIGIGAILRASDNADFRAEYARFFAGDGGNYSADTFAVSLVLNF
ncbi:MAG: outer membrane beta-barrel protein [Gammaproteobacteria bacterium]